jgi:hypothetical protein
MQVLVVGAGVVALAVAHTAALRGHDVIAAEAGSDGAPDPGQLLRMRKVVSMRSLTHVPTPSRSTIRFGGWSILSHDGRCIGNRTNRYPVAGQCAADLYG